MGQVCPQERFSDEAKTALEDSAMNEASSVQRRLVAILAADIAGYSRLMGEDDAATVRDLKGHQSVVFPLIGRYGGRIIDTAGDGILAEFPSVIGAVECAVEFQTAMAARTEVDPGAPPHALPHRDQPR
jgi:class 3 adenylate cyclase